MTSINSLQKSENTEALFETLYDNSPYGTILCKILKDKKEKITDLIYLKANKAISKLTGLELSYIIGKNASHIETNEQIKTLLALCQKAISTKKPFSYLKHSSGNKKNFEVTISHLFEDLIILNYIDVSRYINTEKKLSKQNEKNSLLIEQLEFSEEELAATNEELTATTDALKKNNQKLEKKIKELKQAKKKAEENGALLMKIAENYPNSYLSIIEKDLTIGFTAGQELKKQNLDPKSYVGLSLEDVFEEHSTLIKAYYKKTFKGEEQFFELYINNQHQLYKAVPLYSSNGDINRILVVVENITKLKQTQAQIEEKEQYYKTLIHGLHEDILVIDKDYRIKDINNTALKSRNLNKNEVIGKYCYEISHGLQSPCHEHGIKCMLHNVFDTGKATSVQHKHTISNGNKIYADIIKSPVFDEQGKVIYVIEAIRDISKLFEIQSSLKENEEKLKAITENISNKILLSDRQGNIIYINHVHKGLTKEQVLSSKVYDFVPEKQIPIIDNALYSAFELQKNSKYESLGPDENGTVGTYSVSVSPIISDNKVTAAVFLAENITERKKAEETLIKSEKNFKSVLENSLDAVYKLNLQTGTYDYLSPSCINIYGYTANELIAGGLKQTASLLHPEDIKKIQEHVDKLFAGTVENEISQTIEYRFKHKEKGYRWISDSRSVIYGENNVPIAIVGNSRDITEQKQAEFERDATIKMLELLNRKTDLQGLIRSLIQFMRKLSGCDAIGIRIKEKYDFPYFETIGFSKDFVEAEKKLYAVDKDGLLQKDENGNQVLECTCGLVLSEKIDSSSSLFTEYGSYVCNNTSKTPNSDSPIIYRNRCNKEGYESILLVPLYSSGETIGLIQFNSQQEDFFRKEFVKKIEQMAGHMSIAVAQKKTEADLEKSELSHRNLLNNLNSGVIVHAADTSIILANPKACQLIGLTETQIKGKVAIDPQWRFVRKDKSDMPLDEYPVNKVLKTKQVLQNYIVGVHRPEFRDLIWTLVNGFPVLNNKGKIEQVIINFVDITNRKSAEEELQTEKHFIDSAMDSLPGVFYLFTEEGKFLRWNKNFQNITGYSENEFKELHPLDLIPVEEKKLVKSRIKEAFLKGKTSVEANLLKKDGTKSLYFFTGDRVDINNIPCQVGMGIDITDLKQVEDELKESKALFTSFMDYLPAVVFIKDNNFKTKFINKHMRDILGADDKWINKNTIEIFGDIDIAHKMIEDDKAALAKGFELKEETVPTATGEKRIYETRKFKIDYKDKPPLLGGIALDITERKTAEQALRRNEAIQSKMVANIGDVITIIDKKGINKYKSPNIEKLFGWKPEELTGINTWNNVHPDDLETMRLFLKDLLSSPSKTNIGEYRYKCKDGSYKWIEFTGKNLINDPDIQGILGNYHDISERKNTEKELVKAKDIAEKNEQHAKTIAYLSQEISQPNISLVKIANTILKHGLSLTQSQFGYVSTIDQNTGDNVFHTFSNEMYKFCKMKDRVTSLPKSKNGYNGLWGHALNTKQAFYTNSPKQHCSSLGVPEGHIDIINYLSVPVIVNDQLWGQISLANKNNNFNENDLRLTKELAQIYGIALYRSESDKLKTEIKITKKTAALKQQLLANISHEMRTPMNGIMGMAEFLKDTNLNEQQEEYLDTIINSSKSLLNIINDVLNLSKLERGESISNPEPINIHRFLRNLLEVFRLETIKKNISLTFEIDKKFPPEIDIDKEHFRQIISNFTSNAIKYTKKGYVKISVILDKTVKDTINGRVIVEDTGIGIKKENIQKLFEPFSRLVDDSYTKETEGTGLGLSITKKLAELLGGEIGVESKYSEGSSFWFTFKARINKQGIAYSEEKEPPCLKGLGINILLVEDKKVNQQVAKLILEKNDCYVEIANDGVEALEIFKENYFDIILMDIMMPRMNGIETMEALKERHVSLPPIIGLSAHALEGDSAKFIDLGMDDYLAKPINKKRLIEKIYFWCKKV